MIKLINNQNHKNITINQNIKINHIHNYYNLHKPIHKNKNNNHILSYHLKIKKTIINSNIIKLNLYKILKIIINQNQK